MDSDGGYTIIEHKMIFSEAANLLSPGGFTRLIEFISQWWRESRYGKDPTVLVHFTFLSSSRFEHRSTWLLHRNELEQKGFICNHDKLRGTFELGTAWRSYEPTAVELGIMQKHREIQAKRSAMTTAKFRHRETLPTPGDTPVPGLENAPGNEMSPGLKISPGKGSENATTPGLKTRHDPDRKSVPNGTINNNPQPPTAKTPTPRLTHKRSVTLNLLEIPVWPPSFAALRSFSDFGAWANDNDRWEHWSEDEQAEAVRLSAELEARETQRLYEQRSTAERSPLDKLVETSGGDEEKLIIAVAAALGDVCDRAIDRVRRVYNEFGPIALVEGVKGLLSDPSATDLVNRFKWLRYRARLCQPEDAQH
jgi:hypothetical protein